MKTANKLSKWCKRTATLAAVAVVLTFMSCQNDDDLFTFPAPGASPAGVSGGNPVMAGAGVSAANYLFTFENVTDPRVVAANAAGDNLYDGPFPGYKDTTTGVWFMPTHTSEYGYASGGIAFSQFNDTTTAGYRNQCSVYYDDGKGHGGHGGSTMFAVHYGYYDPKGWDGRTIIRLADSTQTCVFDNFWVMNNTYAARAMKYGEGSKKFTYADRDWFRLVIDGLDKYGDVIGTITVYLADFRETTSPGVMEQWTQVDLTPLDEVTAIRFDLQSSDTGGAGMNTPAYFCFDDLTVTLP